MFVFVLLCITLLPFYFCNHIEEEERAGCFAFIVFPMSCYCKCSVTLPHGSVGCSAVCDCGISCSYSLFIHLYVLYICSRDDSRKTESTRTA